jgi:hypothetical protein
MMNDDEFFLDGDELNSEHQLSITDTTKIKLLETIVKKASEAIDNIKHFELSEYKANLSNVNRYVGAIIEVEQLAQDSEVSEEELVEMLEKIELTAKELSFTDLKEIEKKKKLAQKETDGDNDGDVNKPKKGKSDFGDDF